MSLAGGRAEIAAALSTVTDVNGHDLRPSVLRVGVGWAQWSGSGLVKAYNFQHVWKVYVVIPNGEAAANAWLDAHIEALTDALFAVGQVDEYDPVVIPTTGGDVFAVVFTLRRD